MGEDERHINLLEQCPWMTGVPEEEEWIDVDDAGKSMEGSCASAEAACCAPEAHTNRESGGGQIWSSCGFGVSFQRGIFFQSSLA